MPNLNRDLFDLSDGALWRIQVTCQSRAKEWDHFFRVVKRPKAGRRHGELRRHYDRAVKLRKRNTERANLCALLMIMGD